jgi:hypothetical protein
MVNKVSLYLRMIYHEYELELDRYNDNELLHKYFNSLHVSAFRIIHHQVGVGLSSLALYS